MILTYDAAARRTTFQVTGQTQLSCTFDVDPCLNARLEHPVAMLPCDPSTILTVRVPAVAARGNVVASHCVTFAIIRGCESAP